MSADINEYLTQLQLAFSAVSDHINADIILYDGEIDEPADFQIMKTCRARRPNVLLLLRTIGGSADSAYRIARCLQRNYNHITVFIQDYCKSAGTLLAIVGDELVMSDFGELGPLDVQLYKPDEVFEISSGLSSLQALEALQAQSFSLFEEYMLTLRRASGNVITTRRASEIASSMSIGLFTPIYAQIDPIRLGEINRYMQIALDYGERIGKKNLRAYALEYLVFGYSSHGFVIERE